MSIIKLLVPLLLLSAPAWADNFRACGMDDDCLVVEGICPDTYTAINKAYQTQYETDANSKRPYVECAAPDLSFSTPDHAVCRQGQCVVADQEEQE